MPFFHFLWTPESQRHIAEHGVTIEEFEEVVSEPRVTGVSRASGLPLARGETSTGKTLICIYEQIDEVTVFPITAFERGM